jgi:lysozyme family protein
MASTSYNESLRRLLVHEGGYSNHPDDPGGPTNFGITIADYRKYVKPDATAADVRAMREEVAKAIYKAKYWDAQRCDELPPGVDDSIFDYGVNSGIGRSGKVLRRLLGMSDATSVVTADVVSAAKKRDKKVLINAINDERLAFLRRLKTWPVFGPGWGPRVAEVRAFSLALASAVPDPVPTPSTTTGKGVVPKPATAPVIVGGTVATTSTAGFAHWFAIHPVMTAALIIIGVGVVSLIIRALKTSAKQQQEAPTPGIRPVPEKA